MSMNYSLHSSTKTLAFQFWIYSVNVTELSYIAYIPHLLCTVPLLPVAVPSSVETEMVKLREASPVTLSNTVTAV